MLPIFFLEKGFRPSPKHLTFGLGPHGDAFEKILSAHSGLFCTKNKLKIKYFLDNIHESLKYKVKDFT